MLLRCEGRLLGHRYTLKCQSNHQRPTQLEIRHSRWTWDVIYWTLNTWGEWSPVPKDSGTDGKYVLPGWSMKGRDHILLSSTLLSINTASCHSLCLSLQFRPVMMLVMSVCLCGYCSYGIMVSSHPVYSIESLPNHRYGTVILLDKEVSPIY